MTYFESAADTKINQKRAKLEVLRHGCDWKQFLVEMGDKEEYSAQDVLIWLGY